MDNLSSLKSENIVISAVLDGKIFEILPFCRARDFQNEKNIEIMKAAETLVEKGFEVNFLTIEEQLKKKEKYEFVGYTYLETASERKYKDLSTAASQVGELSARRKLFVIFQAAASKLEGGTFSSTESISEVMSQSLELDNLDLDQSKSVVEVDAMFQEHLDRLRDGNVIAYNLGYPSVDYALGGARPSDMIGLLGASGNGKSLAKARMCLEFARNGVPVVDYTLEMKAEQEFQRMIAMISMDLSLTNLRGGPGAQPFTKQQWKELEEVRSYLRSLPLFIEERKHDLWSILSDFKKRIVSDGAQVLVIDYAQKVTLPNALNETPALNMISSTLREFALKNDIIVILVVRMDKVGMIAALNDEKTTGAEIYGSSAFLSDMTALLNFRLNDALLICDCPLESIITQGKNKKIESKHDNSLKKICPECSGFIRANKNRFGKISILKVRDGELSQAVPVVLLGERVRLIEQEQQ